MKHRLHRRYGHAKPVAPGVMVRRMPGGRYAVFSTGNVIRMYHTGFKTRGDAVDWAKDFARGLVDSPYASVHGVTRL
jgi:hypothetical protein